MLRVFDDVEEPRRPDDGREVDDRARYRRDPQALDHHQMVGRHVADLMHGHAGDAVVATVRDGERHSISEHIRNAVELRRRLERHNRLRADGQPPNPEPLLERRWGARQDVHPGRCSDPPPVAKAPLSRRHQDASRIKLPSSKCAVLSKRQLPLRLDLLPTQTEND